MPKLAPRIVCSSFWFYFNHIRKGISNQITAFFQIFAPNPLNKEIRRNFERNVVKNLVHSPCDFMNFLLLVS